MRRRLEEFAAEMFASLARSDQRTKAAPTCAGCCWTGGASRCSRWPSASGSIIRDCSSSSPPRPGRWSRCGSGWPTGPSKSSRPWRGWSIWQAEGVRCQTAALPEWEATVGVGDLLRSRSALDALGLPTTGRLHPLRPRDGTQLLTERRRPRPSGWEDEGLRACGTRRGQGRDPQRGPGILWTTSRPCWRATVAAGVKRASPESEPEPDEAAFRFRK